jgi:hypothetical protein
MLLYILKGGNTTTAGTRIRNILTEGNKSNGFSKLRCLDDFFKRIALVRINGPFDNVGNRQAKQSSEEQPPFNSLV